jgi:hypothetical protein
VIVAKKNARNGKSSFAKRNKERMNFTSVNKKNFLSKPSGKCKEEPLTSLSNNIIAGKMTSKGPVEEGKEIIDKAAMPVVVLVPRPHSPMGRIIIIIIISPIITSRCWRNRSTCRPKK